MNAKPKKTTKRDNKILFWRVALNKVFIFENVEYNKFSARQAVSTAGNIVTFKDSDTVQLKNV